MDVRLYLDGLEIAGRGRVLRKMRAIRSIGLGLVTATGIVSLSVTAMSQQMTAAEVRTVEKEIDAAERYRYMQGTKLRADDVAPGRCGEWIKKARTVKRSLGALNDQYKGRYNAAYQQKFRKLTQDHRDTTTQYQKYFAYRLSRDPSYGARKIYGYPASSPRSTAMETSSRASEACRNISCALKPGSRMPRRRMRRPAMSG